MTARPISTAKFAEAVKDRLVDTHQVTEILGIRSRQTLWKRVENGTVPPPILKMQKGYSFWDRLAIEALTRR